MKEINLPITLIKENWIPSYIIAMFAIIDEATSAKKVIIDGNSVVIQKKDQNELFYFDDDSLEALKVRLFDNFLGNPMNHVITLSKEESELFIKCPQAAYYFETEKNQGKNLVKDSFLENHEKLFR